MESATFRKWLSEQGCRFDTQHEGRGEGHGTLTIHREGRTAEMPLVGPQHELDTNSVRQVCETLGLAWSDLPGTKGRV
jgi:hypothetical protein